ncbi:MAG: thioredoxin family protein [Patescibacteria group bacterium]
MHPKTGFSLPITLIVLAVIAIIGGVTYYSNSDRKAMADKEMTEKEAMEQKAMEEKKMSEEKTIGMMEKVSYTGKTLAGTSAPLLDFNKSDYESAKKTDKLIVLYFYATWCPICKVEVASSLYPAFNDLKTDKVIGFRVNYNDSDTDKDEVALAKEFGVAYQHTKVFVKNDERILKSPESWDKARYISEIEKVIK